MTCILCENAILRWAKGISFYRNIAILRFSWNFCLVVKTQYCDLNSAQISIIRHTVPLSFQSNKKLNLIKHHFTAYISNTCPLNLNL